MVAKCATGAKDVGEPFACNLLPAAIERSRGERLGWLRLRRSEPCDGRAGGTR
jgi:hypothetical protein